MGKFTNRLKAMDEQWKNSGSGFPEIAPGEYTLQITGAELKESQTSGNLRATFTYTLMDGEQAGETLMDGFTLDGEKPAGMRMLKGLLEKLEMEVPESMSDVEGILGTVAEAGLTVRALIKKSGDFTNVKVQELLGSAEAVADEDAAEADPAEEGVEAETTEEAAEGAEEETVDETPTPKHGYKKGMTVCFKNGADTITGKITKVDGAMTTIETAEGDEWEDVPVQALKEPVTAPTKKVAAPVKKAAPVMKKKAKK
jgi:hypothetical protein